MSPDSVFITPQTGYREYHDFLAKTPRQGRRGPGKQAGFGPANWGKLGSEHNCFIKIYWHPLLPSTRLNCAAEIFPMCFKDEACQDSPEYVPLV